MIQRNFIYFSPSAHLVTNSGPIELDENHTIAFITAGVIAMRIGEITMHGSSANGALSDKRLPLSAVLQQLVPVSWVIVLTVVATVGGAAVLTRPAAGVATATARLSLTHAVEWPYFDASRSRLAARLSDEVKRQTLAALPTGETVGTTTVVVPDSQAYIDIVVTAPTAAAATAAANAFGQRVLADDLAYLAKAPANQVAVAEQSLAASERIVADLTAKIAGQIDAADVARRAGLTVEVQRLEDDLRTTQIRRDDSLHAEVGLTDALTRARLAAAAVRPEGELLTVSSVSQLEQRRRMLQMLVAGLIGIASGALLAWAFARRRGVVLGESVVEHVSGLKTTLLTSNGSGWERLASDERSRGHAPLALIGAGASARLATYLTERGPVRAVALTRGVKNGGSGHAAERVVLVAVRGRTRLGDLSRWANTARSASLEPIGVLIVDGD
jgi:hypothetical protein